MDGEAGLGELGALLDGLTLSSGVGVAAADDNPSLDSSSPC